ncbi:hypothetical protein F5148DRAFT_1151481 [Russula earlei]|uniref:Uncharacterized protein n=1 Tax=Russula earlei TaxID=71964 RepID=A0ACC0U1Q2_9AGAM|nr:hypothetical protein F5148DRAFT_1151481 [Russula earlei]
MTEAGEKSFRNSITLQSEVGSDIRGHDNAHRAEVENSLSEFSLEDEVLKPFFVVVPNFGWRGKGAIYRCGCNGRLIHDVRLDSKAKPTYLGVVIEDKIQKRLGELIVGEPSGNSAPRCSDLAVLWRLHAPTRDPPLQRRHHRTARFETGSSR